MFVHIQSLFKDVCAFILNNAVILVAWTCSLCLLWDYFIVVAATVLLFLLSSSLSSCSSIVVSILCCVLCYSIRIENILTNSYLNISTILSLLVPLFVKIFVHGMIFIYYGTDPISCARYDIICVGSFYGILIILLGSCVYLYLCVGRTVPPELIDLLN